jgi:4-alpha-glucanotransferase
MKVLTFGFDSDESNPHFIGHYTKNTVAYTGTHDNDTTLGWAEKADPKALAFAEKTLNFSGKEKARTPLSAHCSKVPAIPWSFPCRMCWAWADMPG